MKGRCGSGRPAPPATRTHPASVAGTASRIDEVANVTAAVRIASREIGASRAVRPSAGARSSSSARVVPGRMRPSAGGVVSRSPSSSQTLPQAASSTVPSASTSSGAGSAGRASSRRRSRHLCGPRPPGMHERRERDRGAVAGGDRPCGDAELLAGDGVDAQPVLAAQAGGVPAQPPRQAGGEPGPVQRGERVGQALEVPVQGVDLPPPDEHRLEDALGAVRRHWRRGCGPRPRPPRRPRPRSGGPWPGPPRARGAAQSPRRCRRRRPARRGRRPARACGWRR